MILGVTIGNLFITLLSFGWLLVVLGVKIERFITLKAFLQQAIALPITKYYTCTCIDLSHETFKRS